MGYILSGYTATPPFQEGRDAEERFWGALRSIDTVAGIEVPFNGGLHHDEAWLWSQFRPDWKVVITLLPDTMTRLKTSPKFGLASPDEEQRRAALDRADEARIAVHRARSEGIEVSAVLLQSAPSLPRSESDIGRRSQSLRRSLEVLTSADWGPASLQLEHCDAKTSQHRAAKGFLQLQHELDAIETVNTQSEAPVGVAVNWAREG